MARPSPQKEMRGPVEGKSRAAEYQPRGDTAHPGKCGTGLSETTSQTQPNTELGGPGQACKGSPEKERTHEAKGANVLNDILEGTSSSDTEEHQYGTAAQAEQTGGGRADDGNEGQGERTSTEGSTDIGGALSEEEQAEQIRKVADLEDLTDQMGSLSNNTGAMTTTTVQAATLGQATATTHLQAYPYPHIHTPRTPRTPGPHRRWEQRGKCV